MHPHCDSKCPMYETLRGRTHVSPVDEDVDGGDAEVHAPHAGAHASNPSNAVTFARAVTLEEMELADDHSAHCVKRPLHS